jgi:hypothetical protein
MTDPDDDGPPPQDNLFLLYEDDPNWREAERQLKAACVEACEKICAIQQKYDDCGADDTESRIAIGDFMHCLLRCIPLYRPGRDEKQKKQFKRLRKKCGWKDNATDEAIRDVLEDRKRELARLMAMARSPK